MEQALEGGGFGGGRCPVRGLAILIPDLPTVCLIQIPFEVEVVAVDFVDTAFVPGLFIFPLLISELSVHHDPITLFKFLSTFTSPIPHRDCDPIAVPNRGAVRIRSFSPALTHADIAVGGVTRTSYFTYFENFSTEDDHIKYHGFVPFP